MNVIYKTPQYTVFQGDTGKINATLVEFADFLILIDTMYNQKDVTSLKDRILSTNKPLKYVINTHFHFDHFWGNKTLSQNDTIFIAHSNFEKTATSRVKSQREHKKLLSKNRFPDLTFDNSLQLYDLQLFFTPGHTQDSISIFDKENKILITGDTVLGKENGLKYPPYFVEGSAIQMLSSLEQLMRFDFDIIIPGHFETVSKKELETDINYLKKMIKGDLGEMQFSNKLQKKIHFDNIKKIKEV